MCWLEKKNVELDKVFTFTTLSQILSNAANPLSIIDVEMFY